LKKEVNYYENDFPAQGKAEEKGSWLPQAHEHRQRQERSGPQASQGQEKAFRVKLIFFLNSPCRILRGAYSR
jgi:hypothetical protein